MPLSLTTIFLQRPGRLDQLIYIPLPDLPGRLSIFKACLRNSPLDDELDLDAMARATHGFSGADITEICQRAAKTAISQSIDEDLERMRLVKAGEIKDISEIPDKITKITKAHFELAMSGARRSVPESVIRKYEDYVNSMKASVKEAASFKFDDALAKIDAAAGKDESSNPRGDGNGDDDLYE